MKISEINDLVNSERFQEAIVLYDAYIFQYPELKDSIYSSKDKAYKKLGKKLSTLAKNGIENGQLRDSSSDENIKEINLFSLVSKSKNSQLSNKLHWWRVDFVVEDIFSKERVLLEISINSDVLKIVAEFYTSKLNSIFIACHEEEYDRRFAEGIDYFDSGVIAYSIYKLSDIQTIEQIVSASLHKNQYHIGLESFQALIEDAVAIKRYTNDYLLNNYFIYFNHTINSDVAKKRYLFNTYMTLNNIMDSYLKNPKIAMQSFNLPLNVLNIVQYKSQLAGGIDFNIEGFKIISSVLILHGWVVDPSKKICSLRVEHSESNENFEFLHQKIKSERPDVVLHFGAASATIDTHFGFASAVSASIVFSRKFSEGWVLHCTTVDGNDYAEPVALSCLPSSMEGLTVALSIVPNQTTEFDQCRDFFKPIFDKYREINQKKLSGYHHTFDFKPTVQVPTLSIIIPLYGKTRFELTQIPVLAALRRSDWEVIFAVDDLSILEEVKGNVYRLSLLYGLTISVVAPSVNLGFAGINNFAVKYSRSDVILFLNSDCFLTNKLAIERGFEWLCANSDNGAAGFRLTYADRTIQHDGMSVMKWKNNPSFYLNDHPRQGFDECLVPHIIHNEESVLLTAACLMINKILFYDINGFDCDYFKGDFEDSDLCLKILNKNKKLGIVRQPGTYHLERQSISSIDSLLRERITLTNSFTYTERWEEILNSHLPPLKAII